MACKKVPLLGGKSIKKNGRRRGIQRYLCVNCGKVFSSSRRPGRLRQILFEAYFFHRATLQDLARKNHRSREWVQEQIHRYEPKRSSLEPRSVVLVIDATYFGKRGRGFGLLVAKDSKSRLPISYRFIQSETLREYEAIREEIIDNGFVIEAVTIDGRRGLFGLFDPLPVQMCHFHQQQIMTRYLTRNPKSEAAVVLK